jgi:membrane protease YdiL (CAAX protease family)
MEHASVGSAWTTMIAGSPLLSLAVAAVLSAPAWAGAQRRGHVLALIAGLALLFALPALPQIFGGERWLGNQWNWSGQLLALAGMLWLGSLLASRGIAAWREMGFTFAQRPGTVSAVLWVAVPLLALNYVAMSLSSFRLPSVPLETWLYQATLPGLVEETAFRGVLLALADRAFPARRTVFGAPIGWGGVVVTLAFYAAHDINFGTLIGVLPAALLYLWLRARSGSLLVPIVVHNVWNLSAYAAHL